MKGNKTMSERITGTVKWFDAGRGFGFVTRDGGTDVFVHQSAIQAEGYRTLAEGQRVEFEVEQGPKGAKASNVIAL
jgi:CspA family cold shock protein